jgi:hypothetical protein
VTAIVQESGKGAADTATLGDASTVSSGCSSRSERIREIGAEATTTSGWRWELVATETGTVADEMRHCEVNAAESKTPEEKKEDETNRVK